MSTFKPGDLLLIGAEASVQFGGDRALRLRLASVDQAPTYHGWVWLTGYVLNDKGLATDKREVYVQRAGVLVLRAAPAPTPARSAAIPDVRQGRHPAKVSATPAAPGDAWSAYG